MKTFDIQMMLNFHRRTETRITKCRSALNLFPVYTINV